MSSRESIKVKRLSPTPEELRKSMKEASKKVAMWKFKLEWEDWVEAFTNTKYSNAEYSGIASVTLEKKKNSKVVDININNSKLEENRCNCYLNINLAAPTTDMDIAKHIAENIVRSIVCGIQGIAEDNPLPGDFVEMAEERKKVLKKETE